MKFLYNSQSHFDPNWFTEDQFSPWKYNFNVGKKTKFWLDGLGLEVVMGEEGKEENIISENALDWGATVKGLWQRGTREEVGT